MINNDELLKAVDQSSRFIAHHIQFDRYIQRRVERIPHRWMKVFLMKLYCIGRSKHYPTMVSAGKCIVCGGQFPVIHQMSISSFSTIESFHNHYQSAFVFHFRCHCTYIFNLFCGIQPTLVILVNFSVLFFFFNFSRFSLVPFLALKSTSVV